jgi:hypothetical protein
VAGLVLFYRYFVWSKQVEVTLGSGVQQLAELGRDGLNLEGDVEAGKSELQSGRSGEAEVDSKTLKRSVTTIENDRSIGSVAARTRSLIRDD